ncbi:hypothetical protein T440DRAFT_139816 [Plenodomus tracheiphilus IPT5]|uniref:Uncharacterized protein n=1 Tax=Plenodomus tracheiphilus IPT5 TaxID=1408161 RepID=A0A6A7B1D6_9PLEO|nr:hypothetical protein T440DRAFT_139816 [Plenodomus tracheiphilus IPT5]
MAPQQDGRRKNGRFPYPTWSSRIQTDDDYYTDDDYDEPTSTIYDVSTVPPMIEPSTTSTGLPAGLGNGDPRSSNTRQENPYATPQVPYPRLSKTLSLETSSFPYAQPDYAKSTISSASPNLIGSSPYTPLPSTTNNNHGGQRPDGPWTERHSNNVPLYVVASIIPVVVLAIIGVVLCVCLRRRKRRKEEVKVAPHEMKTEPKPTALSYMAPPVSTRRRSFSNQMPPTSTPSQVEPVILGPILSRSYGNYMTGMDTSDVVSVTSNNTRPADPFADNSSLAEPPPPYRPGSVAPPSFVSNSRQSSLRAHDHPPTTSQTHLIERSPFEDPGDDVSDISGPIAGRGNDTMSVVSDMSYQRDPVLNRSAL